jgi:acetoacetyl-CoA synthetase
MEVPIRKILLGMEVDRAANLGAMRNPEAINYFLEYAREK